MERSGEERKERPEAIEKPRIEFARPVDLVLHRHVDVHRIFQVQLSDGFALCSVRRGARCQRD